LLGDPPALMLDEPFNGMDPEGIIWMRGFLGWLAAQGRAVLVSSHLMRELQDVAGHVVVLRRGARVTDAGVSAHLMSARRAAAGHVVVPAGGRVITDAGVTHLLAAASGDRVAVRTRART